jgi:hypothetical protein
VLTMLVLMSPSVLQRLLLSLLGLTLQTCEMLLLVLLPLPVTSQLL